MAKKTAITGKIMQVAGIGAGAVASGYLTNFIPVENAKIKAAAPLVLGFFLLGKKGIIGDLGAGMIAGGSLKLAQSFGIGALDNPVNELDFADNVDTIEVDGFDDPVNGGEEFEEEEI
jgi:hypothetical protein